MLRHLLAEKQLGGSKRLPEYTFSASKEKSHYNLKNVKVWRPWGRIFSPICPTSRPYSRVLSGECLIFADYALKIEIICKYKCNFQML